MTARLRDDRREAVRPNGVWAMDFVHDALSTGRKLRILTVIDTFSRYSPALDPRFSYRGEDVVATLDLWAYQNDVILDFSRPGKPTNNAFIEAFNGRLRAECLNTHWFISRADSRQKKEDWRDDYNEVRTHGAIGNQPPITLMNCGDIASPVPFNVARFLPPACETDLLVEFRTHLSWIPQRANKLDGLWRPTLTAT